MKVGDRASMGILVVVCAGTFVALALTSASKKANGLKPVGAGGASMSQQQFDERLKALTK